MAKEQLFHIQWPNGIKKKVTRSNFYFESESKEEYFRMLDEACIWRQMGTLYLKYNDLIDKMDTPTSIMSDESKDRVLYMALEVPYKIFPPKCPFEAIAMPLEMRFSAKRSLQRKKEFDFPKDFDHVHVFKGKDYNLNKANEYKDEMAYTITNTYQLLV